MRYIEWKEFKGKISKGFLLITAENPDAKIKNKNFNQKQNLSLEKDLKEFDFIKIIGRYKNNQENSFLVFDISEEKSKELMKKYKQKSITFSDGENIYRFFENSSRKLNKIFFFDKKPEREFYTEIKIGGEVKYFVVN